MLGCIGLLLLFTSSIAVAFLVGPLIYFEGWGIGVYVLAVALPFLVIGAFLADRYDIDNLDCHKRICTKPAKLLLPPDSNRTVVPKATPLQGIRNLSTIWF